MKGKKITNHLGIRIHHILSINNLHKHFLKIAHDSVYDITFQLNFMCVQFNGIKFGMIWDTLLKRTFQATTAPQSDFK